MKLTLQQLEAHLWGAANILRGKTAGQDYKNYILSWRRASSTMELEDEEAKELIDYFKLRGREPPIPPPVRAACWCTRPTTSASTATTPPAPAMRNNRLLAPGWSNSIGGRMRIEQSLLAESWNPPYAQLGFDREAADPSFLKPAVAELAKSDGVS